MTSVDLTSIEVQMQDDSSTPISIDKIINNAQRLAQAGEFSGAFDLLMDVLVQLEEAGLPEASIAVAAELRKRVPTNALPPSQVGWLCNYEGLSLSHMGRFDEAHKAFEAMRLIGEKNQDDSVRATAYQNLGNSYFQAQDMDAARRWYQRSLELHMAIQSGWPSFQVINNLVSLEIEATNLDKAVEWLNLLKDIVGRHKAARLRMDIAILEARLRIAMKDYDGAIAEYRIALRLARYVDDPRAILLVLRNLGHAYLDARDVGKALRYLRKALRLAVAARTTDQLFAVERLLGVSLHRMDRNDEAKVHFERARIFATELKDQRALAEVTADLGALRILQSDVEGGLRLLAESLPIFSALADHTWTIRVLTNQLTGYAQIGDAETVRSIAERLLVMYPDNAIDDKVDALMTAADLTLSAEKNVELAVTLYERARTTAIESNDRERRAWISAEIASSLMDQRAAEAALPFWNSAVSQYRKLQSTSMLQRVLNDRAICYASLGMYGEARKDVMACASTARRLSDRVMLAKAQNNLSEIARQQGNLKEALNAASLALKLAMALDDYEAMAYAHSALAQVHEDMQNYGEAKVNYEAALKLAREVRSPGAEAMAQRGLGNDAFRDGHLGRAARRYKAAIRNWHDDDDPVHEAEAIVSLIDCLIGLGREEQVIKAYSELLPIVDHLKDVTYAVETFLASMRWLLPSEVERAAEMCAKGLTMSTLLPHDSTYTVSEVLIAAIITFDQHIRLSLTQENQLEFWRQTVQVLRTTIGISAKDFMLLVTEARRIADEIELDMAAND